jgi:hypothetical protein
MRLNSILPLWRRFLGLPRGRRRLLLEAMFWLAAARLAILLVPFPRIARYLGKMYPPAQETGSSQTEPATAGGVSWAVERAARLLPFKVVCLPRALAAWQMLHRRRIAGRLHFGGSRDAASAALRMHAWLDACGVEVTGYPEARNCVEIGFFAR